MNLKIDTEFQSLIPPLTNEEYAQLEANILQDGCRDPLVVWDDTIIDGHNRYAICTKHGLTYKLESKRFDSREAVMDWMDRNQLGKRNLTPTQSALLRGRIYNRSKKSNYGRADRDFSESQNGTPKSTAEKLAKQYGVSKNTIKRDGVLANAVEKIAAVDPDAAKAVIRGTSRPARTILDAASVIDKDPEKAKLILEGKAKHEPQQEMESGVDYGDDETPLVIDETKPPKKEKYRPSSGVGIFCSAVLVMDRLLPEDTEFDECLDKMISYCEKRKQIRK